MCMYCIPLSGAKGGLPQLPGVITSTSMVAPYPFVHFVCMCECNEVDIKMETNLVTFCTVTFSTELQPLTSIELMPGARPKNRTHENTLEGLVNSTL